MKKLNRQQVNNIIFYFIILIVFLIVLFYGFRLYNYNKKRMALKKQVEFLKKEAEFMLSENENLKNSGQESLTNEAFEKEARIMLGLKKEGENVVILNQNEEPEIQKEVKEVNIFDNFLNFFKNIFK